MTDYDREHIWHPYTSMTDPLPTYPVVSAKGVRIELEDGTELIDGMSSWWCAIHGYNHRALNKAATGQLKKVAHVMFGGFRHEPATQLAQQLVAITPPSLQYVFFSDSGSVSVEVAIKMALQYWHNLDRPGKTRLLTFRGGYHGDTFGAMSVCDPVTGMHKLFADAMQEQVFAPRPQSRFGERVNEADASALRELFEQHHEHLAAFVVEPIVQGAGGMWFYSAELLWLARQLCDEFEVLFIADEIATGFGRTGKMFAVEHAGIEPDIMCVGKALTGGYLNLAATLTNDRVMAGISADDGVLMHGPTFMGNPLACAVAAANIDLLLAGDWESKVAKIAAQLEKELAPYREHPRVVDVRVLGAIGVVELEDEVDIAQLQQQFVAAGVWLRPFGKLIYLMPPYIIKPVDLTRLTQAIGDALDER